MRADNFFLAAQLGLYGSCVCVCVYVQYSFRSHYKEASGGSKIVMAALLLSVIIVCVFVSCVRAIFQFISKLFCEQCFHYSNGKRVA